MVAAASEPLPINEPVVPLREQMQHVRHGGTTEWRARWGVDGGRSGNDSAIASRSSSGEWSPPGTSGPGDTQQSSRSASPALLPSTYRRNGDETTARHRADDRDILRDASVSTRDKLSAARDKLALVGSRAGQTERPRSTGSDARVSARETDSQRQAGSQLRALQRKRAELVSQRRGIRNYNMQDGRPTN